MVKDYRKAIVKDDGRDKTYKKIKGYKHIYCGYVTENGHFLASKYDRYIKNGLMWVTIKATMEGWATTMSYLGSKPKVYNYLFDNLNEAVENCNLFLEDKLVMESLTEYR